jgi:hypothetical protein
MPGCYSVILIAEEREAVEERANKPLKGSDANGKHLGSRRNFGMEIVVVQGTTQ